MKDRMLVTGGIPLEGTVQVSGGKNTSVAVIPAALLCDEPCTIENLPDIEDVHALVDILRELGALVDYEPGCMMRVDPRPAEGTEVSYRNAQRLRASYYLLGALLGRCGRANVPTPGGCDIGSRPVDQHIKGMEALGADVAVEHGFVYAAARDGRLHGAKVYLDKVSVGATMNIILAAVLASGRTIIENAAREPHIVDLANFLNSMGADVRGAGTDTIKVYGVDKLHGGSYAVIPDQIEAGTYMIAAAMTRGDVYIENAISEHIKPVIAKLKEAGVTVIEDVDGIRVTCDHRPKAVDIKTLPYPGFPAPPSNHRQQLSQSIAWLSDSLPSWQPDNRGHC